MTDAEKVLSGDEIGALSIDELVDWMPDVGKQGWVFRPHQSVINKFLYEKLSDAKKKDFVFDVATQRYLKRVLVESVDA